MRLRLLFPLGAFLVVAACTGPADRCASTCTGCCTSTGECQPGNTAFACGSLGAACNQCTAVQSCTLGQCVLSTSNTGGGSANTGGGGGANTGGGGGANTGGGGGANTGGGGGANTGGGGVTGGGGGVTGGGGGITGGGGGITGGGGGITGGGGGITGGGGGVTGGGGGGPTGCNSQSCTGCCNGNVCELGTTSSACGISGNTCTVCGGGLSCVAGQCRQQCSPSTCPNGCCQSGVCLAGTSSSACGTGGNTCTPCGSGTSCQAQQCAPTTCGPSNCSGCCDFLGVCQAGTTGSACGRAGAACVSCSGGASCSSGTCSGGSGTPTGGACTNRDQCAGQSDSLFDLKTCISPVRTDGGVSGWLGGYCSASCLDLFGTGVTCPGATDYCNGLNCYQGCSSPGGGQSSCRAGYVCANGRLADGGIEPNSAHCVPNCNNAPAAICGSNSICLPTGYCL